MEGHESTSYFNLSQLFIQRLFFIYTRKIYVRLHVKITRQWNSTLSVNRTSKKKTKQNKQTTN